METTKRTLRDYLDGRRQNIVPLFQRRYDWERKHWLRFWTDLVRCCDADRPATHFLGSIVSSKVAGEEDVEKRLIIDGQQRLTTFALLLAAVRDEAPARTAGKIDQFLLNEHADEPDRLKLVPTRADEAAFRDVIEGRDAAGRSQVARAHAFLRERVAAYAGGAGGKLDHLYRHASKDFFVVSIVLGESDDPYLIFESLNDKGRRLTQADLVRNTVLMRFKTDGRGRDEQTAIYERLWEPMERAVGEKKLADFFWHYTLMDGADVRRSGAYGAVKRRLDGIEASGPAGVKSELERLLRLALVYRRFLDPDPSETSPRTSALRSFQGVRSTVVYPLLLALHDAEHAGKLSPDGLTAAYGDVESFVVRRLVCGLKTNQLRGIFLPGCRRVSEAARSGADVLEALREHLLASNRGRGWPADAALTRAVVADPQRDARTNRVFLERVERSEPHKEPADLSKCTVEHVLPQTLTGEWRAVLGEAPDAVHAEYVHRLGNLTLTGYNSELSNSSFAAKRSRLLGKNRVGLNDWIIAQEDWGPPQIEERGRLLADRAAAVWPRPGGGADGPHSLAGVTLHCTGPSADALAEFAGGKRIVVLKGSLCRAAAVKSIGRGTLRQRDRLLEGGIVESAGEEQLRFVHDSTFPSPSSAAAFVLGRTADGYVAWRTSDGVTLGELLSS